MEDSSYSEYEIERLKNIQRNEEYLQQMGFEKKRSVAKTKSVKRKRVDQEYVEPVRRSSRVANQEPVIYTEPNVPRNGTFANLESKPHIVNGDLDVGATVGIMNLDVKPEMRVSSGTTLEGSSSSLNADLSYFFGAALNSSAAKGIKKESIKTEEESDADRRNSDHTPHRLCQPIADYGKAAIMALSNGGNLPRFSKYSGAVEWKNCVYLWVNLGGKSGYSNAFSEQGRHIMWFGGSKMHKDSNVIRRIAQAAKPDASSSTGKKQLALSKETVVLFVRIEGENYCCLGRLQWVAIDLLSSPVKVKWELMDYELFSQEPHFKRLIA